MINIDFEYGVDSEIQRVKNTLNDLEWLDENKYRYSLPIFENKPDKVSEKEIKDSVEKEYSALEFETAEKAVSSAWEGKRAKIEKIQDTIIGARKLDQIKIVFTKYGTGGSYWMPNKIIINLRANVPEFLIKTVIEGGGNRGFGFFYIITGFSILFYLFEFFLERKPRKRNYFLMSFHS